MFRRMLRNWGVLLAAAALTIGSATIAQGSPGSQDVYVAPWGSDHAPGTAFRPVRTPQQARDLVRERAAHLRADLTVHLAPGVFRLSEPLTLDARDSGGNGHRIIWQGTGSELNGGERVTGWRPVGGRPGLFSAPAPAGLDNTRQLYVDGVRAQRARGPLPVKLTATPTGYTADAPALAKWRNPKDIELVYTAGEALWNVQRYGLGQWTEPRCPLGSVDGTTVTMAQPCWDNSTKRVLFPDIPGRSVNMVGPADLTNGRQPAYAENAFELLDTPGEWYLDRSARTVYYLPKPGEDLRHADVEAPVLEKLVDARDLHDVAFRGIRYSYATWLAPSESEGFSEIQAGYTITGPAGYATQGLCQFVPNGTCPYASWTREPANVAVSHGQRVEFSDSVFTHLGGAALDLIDGTKDSSATGNVVTDISGNGIQIGGVGKPQAGDADITRDVRVTNNHLYGLPREFHGGVPIVNGYTQRNTISHNQIDHVAYSGISLGWGGWPDKIKKPATPNISHDNVVSDNLIFDYMLMLDDGGGIYTQGITGSSLDDGEKVTGNVIHDQWGLGKGVYTDNGNTYQTNRGNVIYRVAYADIGTVHVDYRDDLRNNDPTLTEGNYWEQGDPDRDDKGAITRGNHLLASPADAPRDIVANAGLEPRYRGLLWRADGSRSTAEAPSRVGTFAVSGKLYATWNPSYAFNGSPVTSYVVTASGGGRSVRATISAADFQRLGYAEVPGVTDGTAYAVTVAARNGFGEGTPSAAAAPVTPGPGAGKPAAAPTGGKAIATASAASVKWTPPSNTGDTPVLGYRITVSDGRVLVVTGRDALVTQPTAKGMTRVVGGLKPATAYTFTVAAVTARGAGDAVTFGATTPAA